MALGASLASPGEKSHGRTVFDSVGSSVVDAAVAAMLVEQASRMQIGLPVDLQSA
jgi:ornithine cyclodeaminase/alanine dehydrogenase-like protein (mu-crystallin family)